MKKLLTVSLVAVMAVSAAHAQIASTNYVDNKVSPVATKVGSADFKNAVIATNAADVTAAVTALDTKLSQVASGSGLTLGADAVNTTNIVNGAVTLDKVAQNVKDSIADAKKAGTDASAALATHKTEASSTYETKTDATAKLNAAKSYTDDTVTALVNEGQVKTNTDAIAEMKNDAIEGSLANLIKAEETRATTAEGALSTRIEALSKQSGDDGVVIGQLQQDVNANTDAIADMKDAKKEGSLAKQIADEAARAKDEESRIEALVTAEAAAARAAEQANAAAAAAAKKAADDEKTRAEGVEAELAADIAEKQVKSGADYVIGMTNGQWKALTELAQAVQACQGKQCALTVNDGAVKWEEVVNQ